jgi:hypothetical protein
MERLSAAQVCTLIRWMKEGPAGAIPINGAGESAGTLHAATWDDAGDHDLMDQLLKWRTLATASDGLVPRTANGARQWLQERILGQRECLLFWIRDAAGQVAGQVCLAHFDFAAGSVCLCDVVCGRRGAEALVSSAVETVKSWTREALQISAVEGFMTRGAA